MAKVHYMADGQKQTACGRGTEQLILSRAGRTGNITLTTCQRCLRAKRSELIAKEWA